MSRATRPAFMGAHRRIQAYDDIGDILGSGGAAYAIIPIGDQNHENGARTTVTTVGAGAGDGLVFTYSEAITAFDTPPTYRHNQLWLPEVTFNGIDEEADSPDAAFWSRASAPFSLGGWVNLINATNSALLSKSDIAGNTREWIAGIDGSDFGTIFLFDESVAGNPSIDFTTDITIPEGIWLFFVGTYDGSADATGISAYQNGAILTGTATDDPNFVAIEDLGGTVKLAHVNATPSRIFDGRMLGGPLGPFFTQQELTDVQATELLRIGLAAQQ